MKNRMIASALLMALLLSIVSCQKTEGPEKESTSNISDTIIEETADSRIRDDLPEMNFNGQEFPILTTTWYDAKNYIYADSQNGDVMNDAIYESISSIEERFGVNITVTADEGLGSIGNTLHHLVMSGDDTYKLYYGHDLNTVSNGLNGDFLNILDLPFIDFEKPWWKGTSENFTVGGKLYFTGNCLSQSGIFMNYVLAVNKELASNYKIDIPYDKVSAGEWYIDDLIGMIKEFPIDLDGDGEMTENDLYGLVTSYYGHMGMQSDLGGTLLGKDKDGNLCFVDNTSRIVDIIEKVEKLLSHGTDKFGGGADFGVDIFVENKALFMFGENRNLYTQVRPKDIVYGILPFPKFDETQENYRSSGCDIYWGIPKSAAADEEMIACVAEGLCCENYNDVVPMIWELVLGRKLADSEEDTAMFNIIRDAQYVDLGYAFSGLSSSITDLIFMTQNAESSNAASYIAQRREAVIAAIDDINATFQELE